jgi:TonB family protein
MARLRADIEQQREALKRKDANTIYNETQRNIGASLAKVAGEQDKETQQNFVDLLDKVRNGKGETITIIGSYPRDACLKKLDGTAKVATVADATGKVIDEPMMITSDYKIFESEALSAVKKHTFDKTGKKKPYLVEVKFEYKKEICPQLSIPEAPPAG